VNPRTEAGPLLAAAAVLLGARAGEHLPGAAPTGGALVMVLTPVALLILARAYRRWRRVAGLALLVALGAVVMARALAGLGGGPAGLAATAADTERRVTVRLAADPQGRWTAVRVPARVEAVDGRSAEGTVLVVATGAAAERLRVLQAAEAAVLLGHFRPLDAGERRWRWRHVGAVLEAHDLIGAGRAAPSVLGAANALRHRVLAGGDALSDTDRALVAGFLVGDDRGLPASVAADFRAAGLSHLLVVSGANVSLALAFAAPLLGRLRLLGRLTGGLAVLVIFAAMTRFEPSVLRAAGMSGLGLLGAFLGRPVPGLRMMALAVAGLVLLDPFLVHSLGFGLSCGASAGILVLAGPLARHLRGPRWVREPLAVTAAAQIGVAPIALPAFGELPVVALAANLAAAPAAAALSLWGLGSGLVGGLLGPDGSAAGDPVAALQIPTGLLAGWIRTVARLGARSPVLIGPRPAAAFAAALALACAFRRRCGPLPPGGPQPGPGRRKGSSRGPGGGRGRPARGRRSAARRR
jgi:competence protein ComEC